MKHRISELHLMTVILLFVIFAFLMQGRAHGAEYKVEDKSWEAMDMDGIRKIPAFYVGGIVLTDKEQADDLAYALNRAHEERTEGNYISALRPPLKPFILNEKELKSCSDK